MWAIVLLALSFDSIIRRRVNELGERGKIVHCVVPNRKITSPLTSMKVVRREVLRENVKDARG